MYNIVSVLAYSVPERNTGETFGYTNFYLRNYEDVYMDQSNLKKSNVGIAILILQYGYYRYYRTI